MTSPFFRDAAGRARAMLFATAVTALLGVCPLSDTASASSRDSKREEVVESRQAGPPVMAVVSLSRQRVTIYDADGWIMRAPISSGQSGYETPAGIYSILQRKAEHYSNLYDDAAMPFMQRLTWSGIALHAGALPGYPASHGCVRMPLDFAERLFGVTRLGMRVIVMRDDISPADFSHPLLFKPEAESGPVAMAGGPSVVLSDADARPVASIKGLRMVAAAKAAEAENAAQAAEYARLAAATKFKEAARANKSLRVVQGAKGRAEAHLRNIEWQLGQAIEPSEIEGLRDAKDKAQAKVAEAQQEFDTVLAEVRPTLDAVVEARKAALAAGEARTAAEEQAREAKRKIAPVSVFISRATQRLYVRQAMQPLFESEVTIADPDRPIGTYVFTALAYTQGESDLRWNAVSLYGSSHAVQRQSPVQSKGQKHLAAVSGPQPGATDTAVAKAALDRISIPNEALERISALVSPGSAMIVSDEPLSRETGPATEFIVVMSGEPQGGIKIRRREPEARSRYQRFMRHAPYGQSASFW